MKSLFDHLTFKNSIINQMITEEDTEYAKINKSWIVDNRFLVNGT